MTESTVYQKVPDSSISKFISQQTVLSMASFDEAYPHCATCFYAYHEGWNAVVFKSDPGTNHIVLSQKHSLVAGTILPDTLKKGITQGIQFKGIFVTPTGQLEDDAEKVYYSKYPFARAMGGKVWVIELTDIIFTDKVFAIGKKLHWKKEGKD